MTTLLKTLVSDVLSLFYPRLCAACGKHLVKGENILCLACHISLPRTGFSADSNNPVRLLFRGRIDLYHASSFLYFRKAGITQKLVHQLKYRGRQDIGEYLGRLMGQELSDTDALNDTDIIIALPLHRKKQLQRGYNQSVCIAEGIAEILHLPLHQSLVKRQRATATQTRKRRFERWENVEQLFVVPPEKVTLVKHRHVLLVDDIITTGATAEACAMALIEAGAARVSVVSLGFAI